MLSAEARSCALGVLTGATVLLVTLLPISVNTVGHTVVTFNGSSTETEFYCFKHQLYICHNHIFSYTRRTVKAQW